MQLETVSNPENLGAQAGNPPNAASERLAELRAKASAPMIIFLKTPI
jgi:hypothetical protein